MKIHKAMILKNIGSSDKNRKPSGRLATIACSLLQRDYKGFSNYGCNGVIEKENEMSEYRIRKLTPKECWRLMGFTDEEFDKAEKVNSNSQLYKQAGNSIVVDVLAAIFKNIMEPPKGGKEKKTLF